MEDEPTWASIYDDPVLSRPPAPGAPGNVPHGEDLRLDIGWERFEQLLVHVAQGVLGLNRIRFRRYGVSGQQQHGIDLAGRHADGSYTVVQCKDYETFKPADLVEAVEKFTTGRRPFGAKHLIIAVSTETRRTEIEDQLAALQDQHPDLTIELWGAEQINDELRRRADIVARFWTRETAETFCTGAPLPGVAAPPPNWVRLADQVLLTPLRVDGLDDQLAEAEELRKRDPAAAATAFSVLADTLATESFLGHAHVLRRKELDALTAAGMPDQAAAVAAQLAATALHEGNVDQAGLLRHKLDKLGRDPGVSDPRTAQHVQLIDAAVRAAEHPLGDTSDLVRVLRDQRTQAARPVYEPLLVLLLAELSMADAIITPPESSDLAADQSADPGSSALMVLDDLIISAIAQLNAVSDASADKDMLLRLRLARATYDQTERETLLRVARRLEIPRRHAALVLAGQARREALDGMPEEAIEHWRLAVNNAILEGQTEDAAGWLHAIRGVNIRYGPWTDRLNDEALLAAALPARGAGRLIRRVRDPAADAREAALDGRTNRAIAAARRWLADSIVTGDWADESMAAELLGDMYARNEEPVRAASCYAWAGLTEKSTKLAGTVGDELLPRRPVTSGPWWHQATTLATIAAQQDLIDDGTAGKLLTLTMDMVAAGRAGELIDGPGHSLTSHAAKAACALAGRGTSSDAQRLVDLFAGDVPRARNHYHIHDKDHVQACRTIIESHPNLARPALQRIVDLAEAGTEEALKALAGDDIVALLRNPPPAVTDAAGAEPLSADDRERLRNRLRKIAAGDHGYRAGLALAALGETDSATTERARAARDRLLNRAEPEPGVYAFGTNLVPDSYLVTFLDPVEQRACLDKMLTVAANRRETADTRRDALTAAANLTLDQPDDIKQAIHARSRPFAEGTQDGSALDDEVSNPHPLSTFKINLGSTSLRGAGLHLAHVSATTDTERIWVRDQACLLLATNDKSLVHRAAVTLSRLTRPLLDDLDAGLLAGHHLGVVRKLAAFIATTHPSRYTDLLRHLANDPDHRVRIQLARGLRSAHEGSAGDPPAVVSDVLATLSVDVRHSVRRAAAQPASIGRESSGQP